MFFTVSGVAGVVYGLISEEWPLTLLSVGLTGRMMVSAAYYICLQVWRVFFCSFNNVHLFAVRERDIPYCDPRAGRGAVRDCGRGRHLRVAAGRLPGGLMVVH